MVAEELAVVETTAMETKKEKKERKKSEKKKSKKRKKSDDDSGNDIDAPVESVKSKDSKKEGKDEDKIPKKKKKKDAKSRLKSKKEEKAELMKKVPLENEEGIAYTKFQIRQMMKRVKRGLPAVATAKELEEKRQNEARLRREEEAELAGLASTRNAPDGAEDDSVSKDEDAEDDGDDKGNDTNNESNQQANELSADSTAIFTPAQPVTTEGAKPKKKPKQNKPVPADYVCFACKNQHKPLHWIYDCPFKVTVRGTNKKKKKDRGFNDPDSKKVFVSGLPFDVKAKAVEDFFSVARNCGTVAGVRLVTFEDTKRCNGQAYVSFDTDEGAHNAIRLSGTTLDAEALTSSADGQNPKKKGKDGESPVRRKELKLKVSKVLNRRKTKRAGRA